LQDILTVGGDDMKISGRIYIAGDNVDTDGIIPARYLNLTNPEELAEHAMEDYDGEFLKKPHEIIVAGSNFGCGSSREHAILALKYSGVKAVVAKSFARIFFRNAINLGLPVIMSSRLKEQVKNAEELEIDLENGLIRFQKGEEKFPKYAKNMGEILDEGGLVKYYLKRKK